MSEQRLEDIDKIVIHHSASPALTTTRNLIRRWHLERGFADIGYHFVVEADGTVQDGRTLTTVPAAQKGANTGSIAICLAGDNTREGLGWLAPQKAAVVALVERLRSSLGRPVPVCGHRDVAPSECPGLEIRDVLPALAPFLSRG